VALSLALCVLASGQDFRVQYLEGLVEVQKGAAWHQVAEGDTVAASAVLRLDDDAVAELTGGGATLRIARRGTYELARLATASAQSRSAGVGAFLTQRARAMAAPSDRKAGAAVAGVRGEISGPGAPRWVGGESADELVSAGIEKLASGAYRDAYALFEDAREAASADGGPDQARAVFYLGYAAYLGGDLVSALRLLDRPRPDPASRVYSDHVLVLAQLLVETFAYADAADLLRGYVGSGSASGDNLQTAQLFLGLSHKGLGNRERAAESLREAQRLNGGSDAGRAAARLLEAL
jgi:tetratricopeptide (TPR) repeat protein